MLLIEQLHQHKPKGDLGASTGPLHRRRAMTLPRASPLSTAPPGPRHAAPPELRRLHTPHIHRAAPPAPTGCSNRKKKKVVSAARSMGIWEREKVREPHRRERREREPRVHEDGQKRWPIPQFYMLKKYCSISKSDFKYKVFKLVVKHHSVKYIVLPNKPLFVLWASSTSG
jgi:hypothetical protein